MTNIFDFLLPPASNAGYADAYGKNIMRFETGNTSETKQLVEKVGGSVLKRSYNRDGDLVSETQSDYVSTDYSSPDLKLSLIFRIKN